MLFPQENFTPKYSDLRVLNEYFFQHGQRLWPKLYIPPSTTRQSVLELLSDKDYRALWRRWSALASLPTRRKTSSDAPSCRHYPWEHDTLISRAMRRYLKADPALVHRLAWIGLLRRPVLPAYVTNILLQRKSSMFIRTNHQKSPGAIWALFPRIVCPCAEKDEHAAIDAYYIPEKVTRLAWKLTPPAPLQTHPFPDHYEESDGLDVFLLLALTWQLAHESPIQIKRNGYLYRKDSQRVVDRLSPLYCPIPQVLMTPALWLNLAWLTGVVRFEETQNISLKPSAGIPFRSLTWLDAALAV